MTWTYCHDRQPTASGEYWVAVTTPDGREPFVEARTWQGSEIGWGLRLVYAWQPMLPEPEAPPVTAEALAEISRSRLYRPPLMALLLAVVLALPAFANSGKAPRGWADADRDCRNTRSEVIAAACRVEAWSSTGCAPARVVCGDLYSGAEISTDSPGQAIDVDHLLPASVAWSRRPWTPEQWKRFYNDPRNLILTRKRNNLGKGALMPGGWCPANQGARRDLAWRFREVAARYWIPLTRAEVLGLEAWGRGECAPGARVIGGRR